MPKRIIVDFDNTMGVPGCDVDDGLALLYLLGCDDAQVEAVCTTYGNSTLSIVHENTERIMGLYGLDVPLLRGLDAPLSAGEGVCAGAESAEAAAEASVGTATEIDAPTSKASAEAEAPRFLVDTLTANPGEIHILATGSTTNLGAADVLSSSILSKAASVTLMGGITQSLVINGRIMDELNLSCDPAATARLLSTANSLTIATSQNCLPAFFTREDLIDAFGEDSWLYQTCDNWFKTMDDNYDWRGWTCWDVVAAAYVMHPELFSDSVESISIYERMLGIGYLERTCPGAPHALVNLPSIHDAGEFKVHVISKWKRALDAIGLS